MTTNDLQPPPGGQPIDAARLARSQIAALAKMRLQTFVNWRRRTHGRIELASRIITGLWMAAFVVGGGIGIAFSSYVAIAQDQFSIFHLLFWSIFFFWQLFPVLATAFAPVFDASNLLRFPIPFPSFVALSLAYGLADPASISGIFWMVCIAVGVGIALPPLLLWVLPALVLFAVLNLLLGRVVFAWLEKWLAKRRAREILGIFFIFLILSVQLIGPVAERWLDRDRTTVAGIQFLSPAERVLPPGFAAEALVLAATRNGADSIAMDAALAAYGIVFAWFLIWRLRQQYCGEIFGESAARESSPQPQVLPASWELGGRAGPIAAVFEKELRYIVRSGPILFSMIIPVVVLAIFRISPAHAGSDLRFYSRLSAMAFPVGAVYALLVLTNLIYNCFGIEGCGIQFYLMAPVDFRAILIGKNLAYAALLGAETILVWIGASVLYGIPSAPVVVVTLTALAFGMQVNLAAGNLFSIYFPKKHDFTVFGRQRASPVALWASLAIQAALVIVAAAIFIGAYLSHQLWMAALVLAILAAIAAIVYRLVLNRAARLAISRRETFLSELCRV